MQNVVNVNVREDYSVRLKLDKFAGKLSKKYNKQRKINEHILKEKSIPFKILSAILNMLCVVLLALAGLFMFSFIFNKINRTPVTIFGYCCAEISSPSMTKTGFKIGDKVIIRAVNTKTLKEGDIIAHYADRTLLSTTTHYNEIDSSNFNIEYSVNVKQFFGVQSNDIMNAAKNHNTFTFHYIQKVFEDEQGNRYFQTKGSTNASEDIFLVRDNLVVGAYYTSPVTNIIVAVLSFITSPTGLACLITLPVIVLMSALIYIALKNFQYIMLENDVVEEKRKLTDEICVKNGIGYRMDKKTKLKVLTLAPIDKKQEYITLLWKENERPENIRKYYLRKGLMLRPMEKLRDVNRQCEQMFKDNVEPYEIAQFYKAERKKIEAEQKRCKKMLKNLNLKAKM